MTRISLKEAYDNRDVIAQIARLNDIVEDLPNPDLTNVVLKTGNQIIDGVKQFNDQVVLAGGMDLTGLGPTTINGDLEVNGDIIQSGAAYETHAEQVFSHNDYIVMRDGAVNSLPAGSYSGLQVKKYDGTNDCRLVVDNQGVARVGDVNDEQPLATRDEVADMTSGALVKWDGVNKKLITSSANVGSDTQPVKIVDGAPVAVANALALASDVEYTSGTVPVLEGTGTVLWYKLGPMVMIELKSFAPAGIGNRTVANLPHSPVGGYSMMSTAMDNPTAAARQMYTDGDYLKISARTGDTSIYGQLIYFTA